MRFQILISVIAISGCDQPVIDSTCREPDFPTLVNEASIIVRGRVSSATLNNDRIEFEVQADQLIRGNTTSPIFLSTGADPKLGFPVIVGGSRVFFLDKRLNLVDPCRGAVSSYADRDWLPQPYLADLGSAIRLADYRGGSPYNFLSSMPSRFLEGHPEESVIDFLNLVSTLEPHGTSFEKASDGFLYRDIRIELEDGVVTRVRPDAE